MSQIIRDITEIARCGAEYRAVQLTPMGLKGCHASYLSEICADPGISQHPDSSSLLAFAIPSILLRPRMTPMATDSALTSMATATLMPIPSKSSMTSVKTP